MLNLKIEIEHYDLHRIAIVARLAPVDRNRSTYAAMVTIEQPVTAQKVFRALFDLGNMIGNRAKEIDSANN